MLMVGFLKWWYSRGWSTFAHKLLDKLHNLADFFSLGLLARTLFYPFRQISAYSDENASMQARMQAFFDKLLSRTIGAIVRIGIMIAGILAIALEATLGFILFLAWPFIPLVPVATIILTIMGVALWKTSLGIIPCAPKRQDSVKYLGIGL